MVSEQDIQTLADDGVMVMRNLVSSEWLDRIAAAIERDIADPAPYVHGYPATNGSGRFHGNLRTWETDPDLRDFCLNSGLGELTATLLGSDNVNLLYDQLFIKEPGTPNPTRWHNDQPYWPVRGRQILSFWISPDPVTMDSGALEFIRGSHKWGKMFQPERFGDTKAHDDYERNPDYVDMPDVEAARGDYDIVTWDLQPGDAYVFHAMTVHGAGGNLRADVRRRGYTVRYTGDDIRYDTRPGTNIHLRSEDYADGARLTAPLYPRVWPI
ncbi:MAG: phytanoyl-CoA dioxygenase family protein [Rhodospirillaceae bacterium]|jgi:ectoine hydroxylase-related dioxygenase (phytanoyl-CoA dioxygenase family)|nr:phytanoyl-CoA dioxygenase family protein [Rhodospirillaceae bacterium]MBT4490996.1 phytanoyl-CoA dioxygenase family protein [Rhodospirillaceae bacterium]MBT5192340.1 phytanoyl-CoA dioxygenase family protein [Rhodospirillaceae bacterium]MBT5897480.1 phytanoyl-CoA dioxygenase family protein [Rhodospirillaceae bacterium]MBT6426264.1 phytanoyl-CoA dioxygenase family protein [Rhodospirillaceae bacterium]